MVGSLVQLLVVDSLVHLQIQMDWNSLEEMALDLDGCMGNLSVNDFLVDEIEL